MAPQGVVGSQPEEELALLREQGYVVVQGLLSAAQCDALREHVLLTTDEVVRQGRNDLLGNIQEAQRRYDLKLDLCAPVADALNTFAERCGPLLEGAVCGPARVVELAAITADGGAVDQPVHADTMHGVTRFLQSDVQLPVGEALGEADEDADADVGEVVRAVATDTALIFTALVALQDVEPDMGPTFVWPATHTVEHHATLWSTNGGGKLRVHEADKVFGVEHLKMTLRRGDAVIYDSRLMHCGSGSTSDQRRSVMVASVMGPGIRPDGTTWTMMKSLRSRLPRLGAFPLQDWALSAAAAPGRAVALPPPEAATAAPAAHGTAVQEEQPEVRPVPPLQEWEAAVQCSLCRRWRPCGTMEAPKLTGVENGFVCKAVGFSCLQEQVYSSAEIDAELG